MVCVVLRWSRSFIGQVWSQQSPEALVFCRTRSPFRLQYYRPSREYKGGRAKCTIEEQTPRRVTSMRGNPVYTHSAHDSCKRNVGPCPTFDTQHSAFDGCRVYPSGKNSKHIRQPQQRHSAVPAPLMHSILILEVSEDTYLNIHYVQRSRRKETMDDGLASKLPHVLADRRSANGIAPPQPSTNDRTLRSR